MSGGPTRREVLGWMAGGAAAGALGACSSGAERTGDPPTTTAPGTGRGSDPLVAPAEVAAGRRLVVVELPGGNDGLSCLVPFDDGRYHDARPTVGLRSDEVVEIEQGWAINRALAGLHADRLSFLTGVGSRQPDLSHFEMIARWWAGTPRGGAVADSAFLGRLCERLGDTGELTGVAIGALTSPAMRNRGLSTTGRIDAEPLPPIMGSGPAVQDAYLSALAALGTPSATPPGDGPGAVADRVRRGLGAMLSGSGVLAQLPPPIETTPTGDPLVDAFSEKMAFAGQIVRSETSIRVVHVAAEGLFFDTHAAHRRDHERSLGVVVAGIERLRAEVRSAGLEDRVLIATTSEFGRRLHENADGLDHGAASTMMLVGPVPAGVHGEPASLRRLDGVGNQVATSLFSEYYATLAAWMGVDPDTVLDDRPRPVASLLGTS